MQNIPFAIANLWATIIAYPFAVVGLILFAIALEMLANRYHCYGLPRNLLFGGISGALAFAFFQVDVFLNRNYGLHSILLAELVAGYETAVVVTLIRRMVFAQRPPSQPLPVDSATKTQDTQL